MLSYSVTADIFSSLSNKQKLAFLCRLGTSLTVLARTYKFEISHEKELAIKLLSINEAEHKIFGFIGGLFDDLQSQRSDINFMKSIMILSEEGDFGEDFRSAWTSALDFAQRDSQVA